MFKEVVMPNIEVLATRATTLAGGLQSNHDLLRKKIVKWEEDVKGIQEALEKTEKEAAAERSPEKESVVTQLNKSLTKSKAKLAALEKKSESAQKGLNAFRKKAASIEKGLGGFKKPITEGHEDYPLFRDTTALLKTIKELIAMGNVSLEGSILNIQRCRERFDRLELNLKLSKSQESMKKSSKSIEKRIEAFRKTQKKLMDLPAANTTSPIRDDSITFLHHMKKALASDVSLLELATQEVLTVTLAAAKEGAIVVKEESKEPRAA